MTLTQNYVSIKRLAQELDTSVTTARELARSKRLRSIKGAVIDINKSAGKHEILRVHLPTAIRVYGV